MEMKEKLYPTLPNRRENPTAPDVEMDYLNDGGHSYRLKGNIRCAKNFRGRNYKT